MVCIAVLRNQTCVRPPVTPVYSPSVTGVYAYVTLKEGVTESQEHIIQELRTLVKQHIASYAVPEMVQVGALLARLCYSSHWSQVKPIHIQYLLSA